MMVGMIYIMITMVMSMTMVKLVTIDCDIGDHLKTSLPCCSMIVLAQRREDRNGKLR